MNQPNMATFKPRHITYGPIFYHTSFCGHINDIASEFRSNGHPASSIIRLSYFCTWKTATRREFSHKQVYVLYVPAIVRFWNCGALMFPLTFVRNLHRCTRLYNRIHLFLDFLLHVRVVTQKKDRPKHVNMSGFRASTKHDRQWGHQIVLICKNSVS